MNRRNIIIIATSFIFLVVLFTFFLLARSNTEETTFNILDEDFVVFDSPEGFSVSIPITWELSFAQETIDGLAAVYEKTNDTGATFSIRFEDKGELSASQYMNDTYGGYAVEQFPDGSFLYSTPIYDQGSFDIDDVIYFHLEDEEYVAQPEPQGIGELVGYVAGKGIEYKDSMLIATCVVDGSFDVSLINQCGDIMDSLVLNR